MLKYSNLSQEQKDFISNGCGGKSCWINPPEFIFHASCNHHDFFYWRGCSESDRKKADDNFYKMMKVDIKRYGFFKRVHYHIWAWSYYKSVRLFGDKFFYFGSKMRDIEDLEMEMSGAKWDY